MAALLGLLVLKTPVRAVLVSTVAFGPISATTRGTTVVLPLATLMVWPNALVP